MRIPFLSAMSLVIGPASSMAIPTNDDVSPAGFCSDVKWDYNSTDLQTVNCIQRFEPPSILNTEPALNDSCSCSAYHDYLDSKNTRHSNNTPRTLNSRYIWNNEDERDKARHASYGKDLPYRSKMLPGSDQNHTSWCFREGALPKQSDVTKVCNSAAQNFDSTDNQKRIFQIQRTKWANSSPVTKENNGTCFCTMLREGTAGLKLCNCDRCDGLQLDFGVNMFGSGYMRTKNPNALYALYGYKDGNGGQQQQIELDPVLSLEGVMPSTCNSGDEKRRNQDHTGLVMNCPWTDWLKGKCSFSYKKKEPKQIWNAAFTDN
ncbi:hypothetical protein DL95DRAFT_409894 [Leptodontidium sp. 2 PMI_412]|nr:hypothetical protein DL95DRAFT_409894 [Leptodontidium sp. 2 PMI_412]